MLHQLCSPLLPPTMAAKLQGTHAKGALLDAWRTGLQLYTYVKRAWGVVLTNHPSVCFLAVVADDAYGHSSDSASSRTGRDRRPSAKARDADAAKPAPAPSSG